MLPQYIFPLFTYFLPTLDTPSPAEWTRKIILGYNDHEYVYMEIKRNNLGSYFNYRDSAFLVTKWPAHPDSIQRTLLRATIHEDSTSMGDWKMEELFKTEFDLNGFLTDKKLYYAFNSSRPNIGRLKFENYGLVLEHNEVGRLLLTMDQITKQSSGIKEYIIQKEVQIIAGHDSKKHLFLTIQGGVDSSDTNFKQFILTVPMEELSDAEKTFRALNR